MALSARMYMRLAAFVPASIIRHFGVNLRFAGIRQDPRAWLGERLAFSAAMGAMSLVLYALAYQPPLETVPALIGLVMFLFGALFSMSLVYLSLYFQITDRASAVEKILPDFLLLTVSNLRAGMPPFAAFVQAARPEFGALNDEVRLSTAKAGGTASLIDALNEVSDYFDSQVLRRTVGLFAKGIHSGGQLAKLLNSSADEVRRIQDMRAELAASTRTYNIFLGFILIIVMPFLLSVSSQFVTIFLALQSQAPELDVAGAGGIPSFSGKILVTPGDMTVVAVGTLLITSLLVSALAGMVSRGKAFYGVKYFPIYATASIIAYFLAKAFMTSMFSAFSIT